MMYYELKKVFSRTGSQIALFLLLACFFAMDVSYVNKNGDTEHGFAAVSKLKEDRKQWSGALDEEKIRRVILENRRIRESPEAQADNIKKNDIAYSRGQGFQEIRELLNCSYADAFRDYDYFRADSLTEEDAPDFYTNRTRLLKEWLDGDAKDQFSDAEKEYLLEQYEQIGTPFYYDYMKGWTQLFEFAPTIITVTMLILGYLVGGIFSSEFRWRSDAIFFSSVNGGTKQQPPRSRLVSVLRPRSIGS